jgi:hypothetical protein
LPAAVARPDDPAPHGARPLDAGLGEQSGRSSPQADVTWVAWDVGLMRQFSLRLRGQNDGQDEGQDDGKDEGQNDGQLRRTWASTSPLKKQKMSDTKMPCELVTANVMYSN